MSNPDPPSVARLRALLAAYDRGEATEGEVTTSGLYRELYGAGERLREGVPSLWFSSYCGSYPPPPAIGTIEIGASSVHIRPLVEGPSLDAPAVVDLLDHLEPRCIFRDYRRGSLCPRPATRFATFYIGEGGLAEDFYHCGLHDFTHWKPKDREALLARVGGEWPPPVTWTELSHAGAVRRAFAWLKKNAPDYGFDPPEPV